MVIFSLILVTYTFDLRKILRGDFRSQSVLGVKGMIMANPKTMNLRKKGKKKNLKLTRRTVNHQEYSEKKKRHSKFHLKNTSFSSCKYLFLSYSMSHSCDRCKPLSLNDHDARNFIHLMWLS